MDKLINAVMSVMIGFVIALLALFVACVGFASVVMSTTVIVIMIAFVAVVASVSAVVAFRNFEDDTL